MLNIDDAMILARAKRNAAKNGLRWDVDGDLALRALGSKMAAIVNRSARDHFPTQSPNQLLDEAAGDDRT